MSNDGGGSNDKGAKGKYFLIYVPISISTRSRASP